MKQVQNIDFRKVIGNIEKDNTLIITDPPYNVGWKYDSYKDNMSEADYLEMFAHFKGFKFVVIHYIEDIIKYIVPHMGVPDKVVQWVYNSNMGKQHRSIAFFNCKPNFKKAYQPYKNPKDKRVKKLMENGSKGSKLYDWWNINLVKNVSKEKEQYSNQIPEKVIENIINIAATENDIIFDPFCGSGTTLAVSKKLKRKYLGCDVSASAVNITNNRLKKII